MNYEELEKLIIQWGENKGILANGTAMGQAIKTLEETAELIEAINNNDQEEIEDAFGDIFVTIVMGTAVQNIDLKSCIEKAYNVISKRNGKMVNGTFVKNEK